MASRGAGLFRRGLTIFLSGAASMLGVSAAAQVAPVLAPPPQTGATARALGDAYRAINRATLLAPASATQASFAYQSALARLRMGDRAGALADAARAQALAGAATPSLSGGAAPSLPVASGTTPTTRSPLAVGHGSAPAALMPSFITGPRDAILRAQARGIDVRRASAHLRDAIDAYLSGDAARAQSEARAAKRALPTERLRAAGP